MIIPKEITRLIPLISNGMIWLYIGIFFVLMYLLISLLTWSFVKPLKYLGIPTLFVGVLFIIIRFSANILVNLIRENVSIIKLLLPSILKPVLLNGIICILVGIVMIVGYVIINRKKKDNKISEGISA